MRVGLIVGWSDNPREMEKITKEEFLRKAGASIETGGVIIEPRGPATSEVSLHHLRGSIAHGCYFRCIVPDEWVEEAKKRVQGRAWQLSNFMLRFSRPVEVSKESFEREVEWLARTNRLIIDVRKTEECKIVILDDCLPCATTMTFLVPPEWSVPHYDDEIGGVQIVTDDTEDEPIKEVSPHQQSGFERFYAWLVGSHRRAA